MTIPPPGIIDGGATFGLTVAEEDSQGNADPSFTGNVTLVVASGPAGAPLAGTLTQPAQNGVATFPGLSLKFGGSYLINATSDQVAPASATIDVIGPPPPIRPQRRHHDADPDADTNTHADANADHDRDPTPTHDADPHALSAATDRGPYLGGKSRKGLKSLTIDVQRAAESGLGDQSEPVSRSLRA